MNKSHIINLNSIAKKGSLCSINGNNYEKQIYNIIKCCELNGNKFNSQSINDLGGSKSINDLQCNYLTNCDIGIEVKKCNTPDWMQCSIKNINGKWKVSENGKIPKNCSVIFENLIDKINLYNNQIPPFFTNKITHSQWLTIKKNTNQWNDVYFDIPNDTIKQLYSIKGCNYIQISDYGLYHTGNDICKFNVPEFIIDQQMRIRTKIHRKINSHGFCDMSIIVACKPKNIKLLQKSKYSLDNINKLPSNLLYK